MLSGVSVNVAFDFPGKMARVLHIKISLQAFIDNLGSLGRSHFFKVYYKLFTYWQ